MKSSDTNRLPYDSLEMLFAFHVSEKARTKREQYSLERAVKEVLAEIAEVAVLIKELECQGAPGE